MKREYAFYKDINEPVENVSMAINGLFFPKGNVRDIHSVYRIVRNRDIKGKPGFSSDTYMFFNDVKELDFSLCKNDGGTRLNCIIREKSMTMSSIVCLIALLFMTFLDIIVMASNGFDVLLFCVWLFVLLGFLLFTFVKRKRYYIKTFEIYILKQIKEYLDVVNENLHGV